MKKTVLLLFIMLSAGVTINSQVYDTLETRTLNEGCTYFHIADTSMPVQVYLVEADLTNPDIDVMMEIAHDSLNLGSERTSELVNRKTGSDIKVLAGVNADFFGDDPRQAQNSQIRKGELIKAVNLNRTLIAFDKDNKPSIGIFRFEGKIVTGTDTLIIDAINSQDSTLSLNIYTQNWRGSIPLHQKKKYVLCSYDGKLETGNLESVKFIRYLEHPGEYKLTGKDLVIKFDDTLRFPETGALQEMDLLLMFTGAPNNIKTMTGGLPGLFRAGEIPASYIGREGMTSERFVDKNPRTAIGYNEDRSKLYIAAVDGRQQGYSMGMTLIELASFMKSVGCYEALNFDGGGSTTMVITDGLINKPSDTTGERAVYNSFLIITR